MYIPVFHQAFMDEEQMLNWINHCLAPLLPNPSSGKRSLLVIDSYKAHTTSAVLDRLLELNVDLAVIPGGMVMA
jgi:DDE superfamily endonuclease